jgi:hypothetical protein
MDVVGVMAAYLPVLRVCTALSLDSYNLYTISSPSCFIYECNLNSKTPVFEPGKGESFCVGKIDRTWSFPCAWIYRGVDKSLARPGRKQAWKHVKEARGFNNVETRAVIKFFFLQDKAPKEICAIPAETLAFFLPDLAKDLSAPLCSYTLSYLLLAWCVFIHWVGLT